MAAFVAYSPALKAGFIWDDDAHLTSAGLRSWFGLWRIWTEVGATQQYYPVLHSTFWLQHQLWGSAPLGYHLANLVFHLTGAVLLVAVLRKLEIRGPWLAGAIFALHPVHVESVAWITEQKNTLSAVFYLGAALVYLEFHATRKRSAYAIASGFFVVGLLTKTVTATLPAALLVVLWWRRGKLPTRHDVRPLALWIALGVGAGFVTVWIERTVIGAEGAAYDLTFVQRCLLAARVSWFYFGKLLWPENLIFVYPRWTIDPANLLDWVPLIALTALLIFLWFLRIRSRAPLCVALLFLGGLFPAMGFFNVYPFQYSFVADHFQYLASIPVIAAAAALFSRPVCDVFGRWSRQRYAIAGVLLIPFVVLSRQQSSIYHDNETLFRATIARNPACWMAYNNLGKELMARKADLPAAVTCLEKAIALRPDYPEAHNNLGLALTQSGRPREAIPHLETSLRLKPASYQTHNNLGIALASSGRPADALRAFAQAATLNPTLPNIHENWAKALVLLGRNVEAQDRFATAARLRGVTSP